jgi:hypothetical protein
MGSNLPDNYPQAHAISNPFRGDHPEATRGAPPPSVCPSCGEPEDTLLRHCENCGEKWYRAAGERASPDGPCPTCGCEAPHKVLADLQRMTAELRGERASPEPSEEAEPLAGADKIVKELRKKLDRARETGRSVQIARWKASSIVRLLTEHHRGAAPSVPAGEPHPDNDFAWLIEDALRQGPWYYCGIGDGWTVDHMKAIRFARREDAERMILALPHGWHLIGKSVEHGWLRHTSHCAHDGQGDRRLRSGSEGGREGDT